MSFFGTDGVRGLAGQWPLVPQALVNLGQELARHSKGPVLVGRDTRSSGHWILESLSAGILSSQQDVWDLGVCPTPVVARLSAHHKSGLGVMISASHNQARDNGIKIFSSDGSKVSKQMEKRFDAALSTQRKPREAQSFGGCRVDQRDLVEEDQARIEKKFSHLDLRGLKIALDTAHGASCELAPRLLVDLGADVVQIASSPDGKNINHKCGSMYPSSLQKLVRAQKCHLGFAFDGDADRCLAVGPDGSLLDGDELLAILALKAKKSRWKGSKVVVGTVMTNGGLGVFLKEHKIELLRTPVGDKFVVARMKKHGAALGGEGSGHIVVARHGLIGDGCLTMLAVLEALESYSFDPLEVLADYVSWPQKLINVPVKDKIPFKDRPVIHKAYVSSQKELGSKGRVLLRYSGTEPLARVMVEGSSGPKVKQVAHHLAKIIDQTLGASQ